MRAQQDLMQLAADVRRKLAPRPLVFYLGFAFLLIYSFVLTQGVSPDEVIGGKNIAENVCLNLEKIGKYGQTARLQGTAATYAVQQLCTNFVCRTRTLTEDDANTIFFSVYSCDTDRSQALSQFISACSDYCAAGLFDVRSASISIAAYTGSFFGRPDYCIFLKKGPMASVLVPKCVDGADYNGQPLNLCMKGFSCYLYGPGAPVDQCSCEDLYDFRSASKEYLGDALTLSQVTSPSFTYNNYYTKVNTAGQFECGNDARIVFDADRNKLEWWFRHKAFPPETTDLGWNAFISNKFPKPICIITFGLLPFAVIFFLLKDSIMYFIPIQENLKEMVAVLVSLLSLVFGTFDNVVLLISKLAGWTLDPMGGFLVIMLVAAVFGAISSVIMKQIIGRREANMKIIGFAASLGELMEE